MVGSLSGFMELTNQVLSCLDEGIHVVDAQGVTIFYNEVSSTLDGLSQDEVLGVHVLEAFPSLTRKTSTLLRVLETGKPMGEQQQRYVNRNGKPIVTVNRTYPLFQEGVKVGAVEISKDITHMEELTDQVIHLQEKIQEPKKYRVTKSPFYHFTDILTQDRRMLLEIEKAMKAAMTSVPVFVVGETGTGKELIVQSIHSHSSRKNKPFIPQNCAAIPSSLLESILFGTAKGAFTGAEDRPGLFELAHEGTLFLDEIQAMPMELQAKLLRVLEEKSIRRVGGTAVKRVDTRILVASNEDPFISMQEGRLRKDLFYRLHVVSIQLPPLRERKEDIHLLTQAFFLGMREALQSPLMQVMPEVMDVFDRYEWPGNVRELKHVIEGVLSVASGMALHVEHLPYHIRAATGQVSEVPMTELKSLPHRLQEMEAQAIREAVELEQGNVQKAAQRLGIPRQTLQYKLKKL